MFMDFDQSKFIIIREFKRNKVVRETTAFI